VPVFGPPGWAAKLGAALPADGGEGQLRRLFSVREHTSGPAELGEAALHLDPVPVHHSVPTWGVKVTHGGRALGYSGDTGPCAGLDRLAADAQMFLCEAGSAESGQEYHCSPEEAVGFVGPARLVLTHLAPGLSQADASKRAGGALVAAPGEAHIV
jgi:ribonuclease BN (tRNA processing enzyme)